uniref:acid phosphatase n=1 Tax=Timema shepardi TaxID=629360 RepID=A0A7R9B5X1_TIMSH|nr:unnamed protein product [Timema shepardi]
MLSSTAEDGEIEVRISIGSYQNEGVLVPLRGACLYLLHVSSCWLSWGRIPSHLSRPCNKSVLLPRMIVEELYDLETCRFQIIPHAPSKQSNLVFCVRLQVFRHGDRNILSVYPFDPYHDNMTIWPEGIGQLTNRGKLQMWELGRYLRQRYGSLVPDLYSPEDTFMTSSDVDRCLMSAQLVLAGLYPARGTQVWNPSLDWQPIPVHSTNPGQDNLIRMDAPCPAYSKEYELAINSSVIQNFTQEHADVFRTLNEQGWPATRIDQIQGVYDSFKIEERRGLILPDWATSIYPDKLRGVLETYEAMRVHTPLMKKLISGQY